MKTRPWSVAFLRPFRARVHDLQRRECVIVFDSRLQLWVSTRIIYTAFTPDVTREVELGQRN